jgi:tRNA-Thr(GGU) m(6)t(6)A37 methyltransferase TsaA
MFHEHFSNEPMRRLKYAGERNEQMRIEYRSIGVIHSPFKRLEDMPIQASGAAGVQGRVEVFPRCAGGLKDLDGFSHIIVLYHFHRVHESALIVTPFLDDQPRGIFATRAPKRPNPIGLSVLKLNGIEKRTLNVENVDILDGTPLLDIKPYVPAFDHHPVARLGWLAEASDKVRQVKSDDRFTK